MSRILAVIVLADFSPLPLVYVFRVFLLKKSMSSIRLKIMCHLVEKSVRSIRERGNDSTQACDDIAARDDS